MWFDFNWLYRKKLTIDNTVFTTTESDFHNAVFLNNTNFDFAKARSDGFDIRFTASDGVTELPYERVKYDSVGEVAVFFVKVDSVSHLVDTDIYIYYGYASAPDGDDTANVWGAEFIAGYHGDGSGATIPDFTGNGNTGTKGGTSGTPTEVDATIGKGQDFERSNNQQINIGDVEFTGDFTILALVDLESVTSGGFDSNFITGKYDVTGANNDSNVSMTASNNSSQPRLIVASAGANQVLGITTTVTTGEHFYASKGDGSNLKMWYDSLTNSATQTVTPAANTHSRDIGQAGDFNGTSSPLDGIVDEIWFINVAKSDSYINGIRESWADNLLTFGSEEENMTSAVIGTLTPELAWAASVNQTLTPQLQWGASIAGQIAPELQWQAKTAHKFFPNLLNYPFDFFNPTVTASSVPMTVSGTPVGYSIYMKDTGSSGDTVIKIYAGNTLKHTATITADGSEESQVNYFDLADMLNPLDTIRLEVDEVAVDSSDLRINVYVMTYPFELDTLYFFNKLDGIVYSGVNKDFLFESADKWMIQFNQPIMEVDYVNVYDLDSDLTEITDFTLETGFFLNSRIVFNPHTAAPATRIRVRVKDMNEQFHILDLTVDARENMAGFPSYVSESSVNLNLFIAASGYRYSFDGGSTFSDWTTVSDSNTLTLDFTGESSGTKNIKVQYLNGGAVVEEDISLIYVPGAINSSVQFFDLEALLTYSDDVPFERADIFYDGEFVNSFAEPIINGFETTAVSDALKTWTIDAGSIYYNSEKYDFDGSAYTVLAVDFSKGVLNYRAVFGFNTDTKEFEFQEFTDTSPQSPSNFTFEAFIPIWVIGYSTVPQDSDFLTWTANFDEGNSEQVFGTPSIALDIDDETLATEITVTIVDVAERSRDFTFTYETGRVNLWRELSVTTNKARSSSDQGSNTAVMAFDNTTGTIWQSNTGSGLPQWLSYRFGQGDRKTIVEYSLTVNSSDVNSIPDDFQLQASNDGVNWDTLHTVSNAAFASDGPHIYNFTNTTAYAYYRLYFTGSQGTYISVRELELRETISGADVTAAGATDTFLPGEIHQEPDLDYTVTTEEWNHA